jgi:hypothetical protein
MNDRVERDNDHFLRKQDEDDLNVPSQRTDVTPAVEEQRHNDAPLNQPNDLNNDRANDLNDNRSDNLDNDRLGDPGNDRSSDSIVAGRADDKLDNDLNDDRSDAVLGREPSVTGSARHDAFEDSTPTIVSDPPGGGLDQDVTVIEPDPAQAADQPSVSAPLFDQDADEVRRRWQEVQAAFVDDPRHSVERADSLLDEITTSLRTALETRTAELQGRWKNSDHNDTEELRTALRDYRAMLEQLLTTTAGTR